MVAAVIRGYPTATDNEVAPTARWQCAAATTTEATTTELQEMIDAGVLARPSSPSSSRRRSSPTGLPHAAPVARE